MRILIVNKFHYIKGGSEKYYFDLAELLRENNHEVALFSMKDEKNIHTNFKEYFTDNMDINTNNKLKALDVIYSNKNKKKMKEALEDFKPDIVHLNNFQRQLSSSIIDPIIKRKIPIVFTAHDIEAICPNKTMLDSNGEICDKCIGGKYFNCIKKKCIKNSKLKSGLGAIEATYYRIRKIYSKKINVIITPSEFYKRKLLEDGIPEEKIVTAHNFIDMNTYNLLLENENYALYFGRLSKEKGILNLIEAFSKLDKGKLYIAGTGPEEDAINKMIHKYKIEDKVKLLGFLNEKDMRECIRKSAFVILPSVWNDNCPYSIIETLSIGKPVIGTNMGGIPELVINNVNGLICRSNDVDDLKEKMHILFENDEFLEELGKNAKAMAKINYSKETYYNKLMKIYKEVLGENHVQ